MTERDTLFLFWRQNIGRKNIVWQVCDKGPAGIGRLRGTVAVGQNIVNGNDPQRAAQAKNGKKTPENAVFGPFSTQNRDFRPPNRLFRIFGPFFEEIFTQRRKDAKRLAARKDGEFRQRLSAQFSRFLPSACHRRSSFMMSRVVQPRMKSRISAKSAPTWSVK